MDKQSDNLIARYLSGDISPAEKADLELWIAASESNKAVFERSRQVWDASGRLRKNGGADIDAAWEDLRVRIARPVRPRLRRVTMFRIAAAITGIGLTFLILYFTAPDNSRPPFTNQVAAHTQTIIPQPVDEATAPNDAGANTTATVTTKPAKKRGASVPQQLIAVNSQDSAMKFELPDGTVVYLNRNSKITFPENFAPGERTIYLTGEAYFEVAHNKGEFKVICQDMQARVLGTSFNVKGYAPLQKVEVMVEEGLVEVRARERKEIDAVLLKKGEQASYVVGQVAITKSKASRSARWWKKAGFRTRIREMFNRITSRKK
jgi:transmembrane sensor